MPQRRLIGCIAALSTVMLLILASPLLRGRVPVFGDMGDFHLPLRQFYARCLAQGESFDWMPSLFGGFFLTGEGQLGGYHPLHLLLYRCLPVDTAFALEMVIHGPLLLIGMVFFLRRHIGSEAAWMGGMLFTFSTTYMFHMGHPNLAAVLAHVPWLLWAMDVAVFASDRSKRMLVCAAIGFLTASQILLGHPQALWFSLVTELAYAVFLLTQIRPRPAACAAVAGGKLLGLMIGAVQLFATYAAFTSSTRAEVDLDFIMFYSLHPWGVVGLLAPCLLWGRVPGWMGIYCGAVPLMLILWWVTAPRTLRALVFALITSLLALLLAFVRFRWLYNWYTSVKTTDRPTSRVAGDRLAIAALVFALITLLLAFGRFGWLYYWHTFLPVVGKFRVPTRFTTLMQLGVAVAAAVAFSRLVTSVRQGRKVPWSRLWAVWTATVAAVLLAVILAVFYSTPAHRSFQGQYLSGPVLLAAAAGAVTLAARGHRVGLFALAILAAVDLGLYTLGNRHVAKFVWRRPADFDAWVAQCIGPPGPKQARLLDESFEVNRMTMLGYRMANGYAAIKPNKTLDYRSLSTLRVAEVGWYRRHPWEPDVEIPGLQPLPQSDWQKVPDPLPRVRLVCHTLLSRRPADDLKRIDVATTALVTHRLELSPGAPGTAAVVGERPGEIRVQVEAPARRLLVLSESYDPGWQVQVDGSPATLKRVNGDFFGCVVEAGSHRVTFAFRPVMLWIGKLLSVTGLAIGLLLCAAGWVTLGPLRK